MNRRVLNCAVTMVALAACTGVQEPGIDSTWAATLVIEPQSHAMAGGGTFPFTATVRDLAGRVIPDAPVAWTSDNAAALSVSAGGQATAAARTTNVDVRVIATHIATHATLKDTAIVTVTRGPYVLSIWPDTNRMLVGTSRRLNTRIIRNPIGSSLPNIDTVRFAIWSSSDSAVATVDASGRITAISPGHARIAAHAGGEIAFADVYVSPDPELRFTMVAGGPAVVKADTHFPVFDGRGCGLTADGSVYCWGAVIPGMEPTERCERWTRISPGSYGIVRYPCSEVPRRLPSSVSFTSLSSNGHMTCAVATTKRVYCWGANASGYTQGDARDTTTYGVTPIASTDEFRSVHVEDYTATKVCAVRTDDVAFCWDPGATPKAVTDAVSWRVLANSPRCGLATDSTAHCFLAGTLSQLSGGKRWSAIATGRDGVCVLDGAGKPHCGSYLYPYVADPTPVNGEQQITTLVTFSSSFAAPGQWDVRGLSADGTLYRFGASMTPVDLGGVKLKSVSGTCGIALDDRAWCWGWEWGRTANAAFRRVPGQ